MTRESADKTLRLLELCTSAAHAYDRPDLAVRLTDAKDRLLGPAIHVLVVGEFKQGKSTLINALLNVDICPASDDVATVVPTMVRHGAEPSASLIVEEASDDSAEKSLDAAPARIRREPLDLSDIATMASERGDPEAQKGVRMLEVAIPRRILESGMAIIDTPGVGGLNSVHGAATESALSMADMVLFVTDASQELSANELAFFQRAYSRCENLVVILTKIDIYPQWRRILDINRGHLASANLPIDLIPVSSVLRRMAHDEGSKELNDESGFPVLVSRLDAESNSPRARQTESSVVDEAIFCIEQMEQAFVAEQTILEDPDAAARVIDELESARDRATALRARSAKWQQTLTDGSQDLTGDIDHDLRLRVREVIAAAEDSLDEGDPAAVWPEFAPWLEQRVAAEVALNSENLRSRADELAIRVADHFAADEAAIDHNLDLTLSSRQAIEFDPVIDMSVAGLGGNALTAARGAYGGVLMFGMVGQLAGLALLNPLTLVVGIGLGRKALKDERKRNRTMRQQQAKAAVRKYIDAITFEVSKESRDLLRRVQRDLRDEFSSRAEHLQVSTRDALAASEAAAKQQLVDRQTRLGDVRAELARLAKLRKQAEAVTG